jgi:hypothetical protein
MHRSIAIRFDFIDFPPFIIGLKTARPQLLIGCGLVFSLFLMGFLRRNMPVRP